MNAAIASIGDAFDDYCANVLPIDLPEHEAQRLRRAYFDAALQVVEMIERGVKPAAIRSEVLGFARTIGRPVEAAR